MKKGKLSLPFFYFSDHNKLNRLNGSALCPGKPRWTAQYVASNIITFPFLLKISDNANHVSVLAVPSIQSS